MAQARSFPSSVGHYIAALPRPNALSPSPTELPYLPHNTRRYAHTLAGSPDRSGRGYADFRAGVNFV